MNSKYKGNVTELAGMLAFMEQGYNVLTPYGDCERYDFVVDNNGTFIRIQCKTASTKDEGASFKFCGRSTSSKNGQVAHYSYSKDDIDYFLTYFNKQCYLIPVEECGSDKSLRLLPTKSGQTRGICWAKNYELEEVIKKW